MRRNLDRLMDPVLDLSTPSVGSAAAGADATPAAAAPAPATGAGQGKNETPADPAKSEAAKPEVDTDERIIELSRTVRAEKSRAQEATGKLADLEGKLARLEPLAQLFQLAEKDPQAFIDEVADVMALTPERVLEMLATRGAGGDAALSAEDRIAMLERKLAEQKEPKPAAGDAAEQARQGFLAEAKANIEAVPELFPLAATDPAAPEAVFLTQVRHWERAKKEPGFDQAKYKPLTSLQAVHLVEKVLRARKSAESTPAAAGTQSPPSTTGGLSRSTMGAAPAPIPADTILTDQEIRANLLRALGR
jgi:hypothetical protein